MRLVKVTGILLILVVPLLVVMGVFMPIAAQRHQHFKYEKYSIPKNFTKIDFLQVLGKMRLDPEFAFYFQTLPDEKLNIVIEEVYTAIDKSRSKEKFFALLSEQLEEVRSLADFFQSFDYEKDVQQFSQQPPEFYRIIWVFFCEELKLTVLGLCYKVMYDRDFSFVWDTTTRQVAGDMRAMITYAQNNNAWPPDSLSPVENAEVNK